MFYCDSCAKKRNWPESWFRSKGPCEVCGKTAVCYEVSSAILSELEEQRRNTMTTASIALGIGIFIIVCCIIDYLVEKHRSD